MSNISTYVSDSVENIVGKEEIVSVKVNKRKNWFLAFLSYCQNISKSYLSERHLTHYHTIPHFDAKTLYSCGKHCEKRRNCL